MPNVFGIDEKGEFNLPDARIVETPEGLNRMRAGDNRPILYRPKPAYWADEWYDAVFRWVYERRHTTLYVDEIYAVMKHSGRAPQWLQACLTRGRSLGITCVNATQRPFAVPISILSEAKHYFVWPLPMEDDRKRMKQICGPEVARDPGQDYAFHYFTRAAGHPRRNQPAEVYLLNSKSGKEREPVNV